MPWSAASPPAPGGTPASANSSATIAPLTPAEFEENFRQYGAQGFDLKAGADFSAVVNDADGDATHAHPFETGCGSVGFCAVGAAVMVYPDGVWYAQVRASDVPEIVEEHLVNGRPVERLALLRVPTKT